MSQNIVILIKNIEKGILDIVVKDNVIDRVKDNDKVVDEHVHVLLVNKVGVGNVERMEQEH